MTRLAGRRLQAAAALLLCAGAGLSSTVARAAPELGLRVGYAFPKGWVDRFTALDTRAAGQLPLRLDALYRLGGLIAVGAFGQYGYTFVSGDFCGYNSRCQGSGLRLGLQGTVHIPLGSPMVPWVGVGVGYEWLRLRETMSYQTRHYDPSGLTLVEVHAGGDYFVLPDFTVGPYAGFTVGRYTSLAGASPYAGTGEIGNQDYHGWIELGLRGTFSLLGASPVAAMKPTPGPAPTPPVTPAEGHRFELGLRLGYALPMGEAASGGDLDDGVGWGIPLRLDGLYRLNARHALGASFTYGYARVTERYCAGQSCAGRLYRVGVTATTHFAARVGRSFVPWAGVGVGYEWLRISRAAYGYENHLGLRGLELLSLQLGADRFTSPGFAIGPFVGLSVGRYDTASTSYGDEELDEAFHAWLEIGVRGAFRL
jgi:hypothetical protein